MIIKISNLSDGVHNYVFEEPVEGLELGESFSGNIKVNVELSKVLNQIIVEAELTFSAKFNCDRCTAEFDSVLTNNYKMVYLFGIPEEETGSVNITYLPFDADKIDITEDVRDYALLAVPMKKLCRDDCKGLCFKCGKDLNEGECGCEKTEIDPRWLPLKELKNKININ